MSDAVKTLIATAREAADGIRAVIDYVPGPLGNLVLPLAHRLDRDALAAERAGDDEEHTDEWLERIGFTITNGTAIIVATEGPMYGRALIRAVPNCPHWIYQQPKCWDVDDDGGTAFIPAPKTRSDVRQLCRCLAIPLLVAE
jgi:hypothetical protein